MLFYVVFILICVTNVQHSLKLVVNNSVVDISTTARFAVEDVGDSLEDTFAGSSGRGIFFPM